MARNFTRASSQALSYSSPIVTAVPFSVSFWVNMASLAPSFQLLFSILDNTANGYGFYVQVLGTTGQVRARQESSSGTGNAASSVNLVVGTWSHICAVFATNASRSIYVDNNKVTNTTGALAIASLSTTDFGRFNATFGEYLSGDIAFPAIWPSALTDAEVTQLSKGFHPKHVKPFGLLDFWDMSNGNSPEVGRVSSTPLSLVNAPPKSANPRIYY